jgi:lipoyl synthase
MKTLRRPLPAEYKREIPAGPIFNFVNDVIESEKLHTICVSGKCPNRGECFSRGSLAFMILGDTCTRHCGFCAVKAGNPEGIVDWEEPKRLGQAVKTLKLKHAVITAVARDDLKDGGAAVFASCIREVRAASPETIIEVLTSDFEGQRDAVDTVLGAKPDIFNHNMETVERLTPKVRSKATYHRSLAVLNHAKAYTTKSGIMLGLGETREEVMATLKDLRSVDCNYLTIGQYLQPSTKHLTLQHFVPMDDFHFWKMKAHELGFSRVASGPLVRSSYFADELHTLL